MTSEFGKHGRKPVICEEVPAGKCKESQCGWFVTICNYSCVLYGTSPHYMKDTTQDLVLIRFADVLLMHAEMTRTIDGINRVRTRAQLPPILVIPMKLSVPNADMNWLSKH